uniref:Uncharacterized protein n=1 Tax=Lates calcarifer TaxID=8187 RepID=A0A4W6F318_LATCA
MKNEKIKSIPPPPPRVFVPAYLLFPPIIFASPTKLVSETRSQVEYMGANRVQEMQKLFQADGVPVHLKRGLIDRLLYRTTMGLTVGGCSTASWRSTSLPSLATSDATQMLLSNWTRGDDDEAFRDRWRFSDEVFRDHLSSDKNTLYRNVI